VIAAWQKRALDALATTTTTSAALGAPHLSSAGARPFSTLLGDLDAAHPADEHSNPGLGANDEDRAADFTAPPWPGVQQLLRQYARGDTTAVWDLGMVRRHDCPTKVNAAFFFFFFFFFFFNFVHKKTQTARFR
jgi:hypothetical protein